ncbi:MAG TPA: DUF2550 family protein [Thermoleophilaceae bacterium]|nr:DUF2550 family protein [Thermoleophilaceae bacterium]
MVVALLAVLGVDLVVVALLLAGVLTRKRWVKHQPGSFRCTVRLTSGEIDGIGPKWKRGYGRWVRDVFVWTKAPLLFRNELVPSDGVDERRPAAPGEVKRLGDQPVVVTLASGTASVQIAAHHEDRDLLAEPARD